MISRSATLLLLLLPSLGCNHGWTHNPVSFPNLPLFGDIVRTHSKPAGEAYFRNYDRWADHLEVTLQSPVAAVQSRQVIVVSVLDAKNNPLGSRCVEWTLEGAGSFLEVDESGLKPGRGYKVDARHAVTYTDYFSHTLKKFNGRAEEDIVLKPGQSWAVISSMTEGDTQLSIWAPEIANWDENRRVVTIRWVDAEWILPPIQAAPRKSQPIIATQIRRRTDRAPVAGYRIRYRVLDGAPAVFTESRGSEAVVSTDEKGAGIVSLTPTAGVGGRTRIGIDIIRPGDPTVPTSPVVVIGQGETAIDWEAPALSLEQVAPASATVGQQLTLSLLVSNKGAAAATNVTVRTPIPAGTSFVAAEPLARVEGAELVWTIPTIPGRGQAAVRAIFKAERVGPSTSLVSLLGSEGERDDRTATIQILPPEEARLKVEITGPRTASLNTTEGGALPGDFVNLQVTVTNEGTGVASKVRVLAELNDFLEHSSRQPRLNTTLDDLSPGQSRTLPLPLRPMKAGNAAVSVTAFLDQQATQPVVHPIIIRDGGIVLRIVGPASSLVGKPVAWNLEVHNRGSIAVENAMVQARLPAEVEFVGASGNALRQNGELSWMVGKIEPNQKDVYRLEGVPRRLGAKLITEARVVGRPKGEAVPVSGQGQGPGQAVEAYARSELTVVGVPSLKLRVTDRFDPIEVGGVTTYRILVTNDGSSPVEKPQVMATLPPEMRFDSASGPTQHQHASGVVSFNPIESLVPGQTATYMIEVTALRAGDARLRVELVASPGAVPLLYEESTNVR